MTISLIYGIILCAVLQAPGVLAQKVKTGDVPAAVLSGFHKLYPNKTAGWEKEKGKYEAGLTLNGRPVSLLFDQYGSLLETETAISLKQLPATALAYIRRNYPGATIKETAKIVKADGTFTFEAAVKGKDLLFTPAGEFLNPAED